MLANHCSDPAQRPPAAKPAGPGSAADGRAPAHTAVSSPPCSCGFLGGLPSEQAADRRQGTTALQGVPAERAAALWRARQLGRPELRPHCPLAAGLGADGCQPGRPGPPRAGHLLIHPGLRLCQHGPHGCAMGPLHVPGQRGTDLVRGRTGHQGGRYSGPQGRYTEPKGLLAAGASEQTVFLHEFRKDHPFLRLWGHCWSHSAQTQGPPASGVTLILLGVSGPHLRPRCPPPVLEDCVMGGVERPGDQGH